MYIMCIRQQKLCESSIRKEILSGKNECYYVPHYDGANVHDDPLPQKTCESSTRKEILSGKNGATMCHIMMVQMCMMTLYHKKHVRVR